MDYFGNEKGGNLMSVSALIDEWTNSTFGPNSKKKFCD